MNNKLIRYKTDGNNKYILQETDSDTQIENTYFYLENINAGQFYIYILPATRNKLYISIGNGGEITFDTESRTKFDLIKYNGKYKIKKHLESLLITYDTDRLVLKQSININNPDDNQLFTIEDVQTPTMTRSIEVTRDCYGITGTGAGVTTATGAGVTTATTPSTTQVYDNSVTIQLTDVDTGTHNIECGANQYLTSITRDDSGETLTGNCLNIPNRDTAIEQDRESFFRTPVSFNHTHSFVSGDRIHQTNTGTPSVDEDNINTLELYSDKHATYLNTFAGYSPIQKIFLTMILLRLNGVKKVKIEYDSMYKFFKKQSDMDTTYDALTATISPQTATISPQTGASI